MHVVNRLLKWEKERGEKMCGKICKFSRDCGQHRLTRDDDVFSVGKKSTILLFEFGCMRIEYEERNHKQSAENSENIFAYICNKTIVI